MRKPTASFYGSGALPLISLTFLITASASAAPSEGPERTRARELGYAGVEAYSAEDFATANVKLEEAYGLVAVPSLGLWSARTLVKLGKWVEAEERYRSVSELVVNASDSEVQRNALEEAARERSELLKKLPAVIIELSDARSVDVAAWIDGVSIDPSQLGRERSVNPGRHTVTGVRGDEKVELAFEVKAGERKPVLLRFTAASEDAPPPPAASEASRPGTEQATASYRSLRAAGWVALIAGGAGLLTGSLAYLVGKSRYSRLEDRALCVNSDCPQSEIDAYNNWRAVNLAGLIGGGVLGAAGFGLLIAVPMSTKNAGSKTTVAFRFDSRSLTVGGSF